MAFTPHPLDRHRATLPLESDPLDKGGQGVVTRVLGPENLVYKEYMPQAGQVNGAALAELVEFGHRQTATEVRALLHQCAWPVARVVHGGQVTGFLMPHVPRDFYGTIGGKPKLVELQYLLYEPNWAWQDLHQPDVHGRLEIATLAAKLIDLLHTHGWIVGDLSFRNLLWRPGQPYKVFMLDCDGLRRHGAEPVLRQAHTPDWNDPYQPSSGPDMDTDRYKLALLVGRVLSRTPSVRPGDEPALLPGLPDHVVTAVGELFTRAQGPRGTRPIAAEWVQALIGRKRIAVTRPARQQRSVHSGPDAPIRLPGTGRVSVPVSRPARGSRPPLPPSPSPPSTERSWTSVSPMGGPTTPAKDGNRRQPAHQPRVSRPGETICGLPVAHEPVRSKPAPAAPPPAPVPVTPAQPIAPPAAVTALPTLGQRVVASDTYAEQRRLAPRGGVVDDDTVARIIDHLAGGTGRGSVADIAQRLGETPDRTVLLMRALKNLLNVEQTDVIMLKDRDRTVELNVRLLEEQFLEEDEP
ncbi:hypothetical protein FLW53_14000 [Microbispora sp. SCL1-1]|uniref:hypothetical protein n=1 Tax=unclassified Microbispora TaxID=2614687 RepID=UPI001157D1EA|nr:MULTISPECIES: hypothetical protein [unclassified Microbispora]NJP25286.1 hypothetical protein [Microbispora sp. CL1-1]TQS13734.1 hypothetical protein FLW53_14000 [Microbispora sp. SCL1-1]